MQLVWRRLGPYLRQQMPALVVAYLCMAVLACSGMGLAFLSGPALQTLFSGRADALVYGAGGELRQVWQRLPWGLGQTAAQMLADGGLWLVPALVVANSVIKGIAQTGQFTLLGRVSLRVQRALRRDAFAAMVAQSPQFHLRHRQGDLISRLTHDCALVEQAVFYGLGSLLRDTLAVCALLGFCFVTDAKLAVLTLVVGPCVLWPLATFAKRLKGVAKRGQAAQGDISQTAHETLAGLQVVQACQQEEQSARTLATAADAYVKQMDASYFVRAVRTPVMEILGSVAAAAGIAALSRQAQANALDAAHTLSFMTALLLLYDPIKKLGLVSDYLAAGAAALERIGAVIDAPHTLTAGTKVVAAPIAAWQLREVHFAYGERAVLQGLNLTLAQGQTVALVGPSGAGKTTVAQLLMRFWDPTQGSISADGRDIRSFTLASLRAQMSHVGQETFLFDATVAQNIAYGRPGASHAEVVQAAQAAHAAEFIEAMPQGYATRIGERGLRLSGGQRQRLAIARAMLRNTPLLILDEATSSLDTDSEALVQAGLQALMAGRTSLVIAHRLATITRADAIVVLRHGRVVEQGAHADLIARGGHYARLHRGPGHSAQSPVHSGGF